VIEYLLVKETLELSSLERAKGISKELWSITLPDSQKNSSHASLYLLDWLEHPITNEVALEADMTLNIDVSTNTDLTDLLKYFPSVPEVEKQQLKAYIESNKNKKIRLRDILPSTTIYITDEELKNDGWIGVDELIEQYD